MLSKEELGSHGITWHEREEELPYTKGEYVAQGATGRVYKASLGSEVVAVKMIQLIRMPKAGQLRAARECRILQALNHQNILRLLAAYYIHHADSIVLVTMPWAPVTLDDFMQDIDENNKSSICLWYTFGLLRPWPELIRQSMEGLEYLHTREPPIKHKDLKPDNILLLPLPSSPFVRPIIADFGISKEVIPGTPTTLVYTYIYRSPEQGDKKESTLKSDVYQLGCCLVFIEGILHSGRVGFRHVYDMVLSDNPDDPDNTCRFAGNLARIHTFLDEKISDLPSATHPNLTMAFFRTEFRELVRQMVVLDPNDRLCISSALRKFKYIDEAARCEYFGDIGNCSTETTMSGLAVLHVVASASQLVAYGISILSFIAEIYERVQDAPRQYREYELQLKCLINIARVIQQNPVLHLAYVQRHLNALLVEVETLQSILAKSSVKRKYWNAIKGGENRKISGHLKSLHRKSMGLLLCISTVNTTQLFSVQGSVDKLIDMNAGYGQKYSSD